MGYKLVYNTDTKVELKYASGFFSVYLGDEIPATTTTTTIACFGVALGTNKISGSLACTVTGLYRLDTNDLATASAIYTDASCTTYATNAYYSDGSIYRRWINPLLSASYSCPPTTTTTTTIACFTLYLGYGSSSAESCYATKYEYSADTNSISTATKLYYAGANCTEYLPAGYFTDYTSICRYWNGTAFEGGWIYCPTTTTTAGGPTTTTTTTHASCTQISGSLYFSVTSGQAACNNNTPLTLYGNNSSFASTTTLHTNGTCGAPASSGYYSNKSIWRYWGGSSFSSSGPCESPD
jgi:hypothetical protein